MSVRAEGLEPPVPLGRLLYRQLRLTVFASHALPPETLPGQDSNLQSRINSPMVCRINRPGTRCAGRPSMRRMDLRALGSPRHHGSAGADRNRSRTWGSKGSRIMLIPASAGVRSPLRPLHGWHAATRLHHVSPPPRDRGSTWSMVSARAPQ